MFVYNGKNKKILSAVKKANDMHIREELRLKIKNTEFEMSTAGSDYLARGFINFVIETDIFVKPYSRRWSKALAYFTPNRPKDININTAKLKRSEGSIVGTFYHEAAHMFDKYDTDHEFGHGSNSSKGKEKTFPYAVGSLVKDIVNGGGIPTPVTITPTMWTRFLDFIKGVF